MRGVLDGEAARILQQVGPADAPRYTFAHETLLARCQDHGLGDPGHGRRIDEWAATWRDRGLPAARDGTQGTPPYLLDSGTRGCSMTIRRGWPNWPGDVGWVTAAIQALGVDAVLAELKTADAAAPGEPRLAAMHAVVRGQAQCLALPSRHRRRPPVFPTSVRTAIFEPDRRRPGRSCNQPGSFRCSAGPVPPRHIVS